MPRPDEIGADGSTTTNASIFSANTGSTNAARAILVLDLTLDLFSRVVAERSNRQLPSSWGSGVISGDPLGRGCFRVVRQA